MRDLGHEWTQEQIDRLERRIRESYREAIDDIQAKMDAFIARFLAKDEELRKRLEAEKITQADYQMWLNGQVFQRKRWQATLDDLTETLARANQLAMQIINDAVPEAFAYNANWAAYNFEKELDRRGYNLYIVNRPKGIEPEDKREAPVGGARVQFGWGLYNVDAVKRLLRDEPNLLPPSRVDIPKDKRWNMGNITRQIMQGIVQGESLEQVARRLPKVAEMNIDSARTHARTALTAAQNAGRLEQMYRQRELARTFGMTVQKKWKSAKDTHVRKSHGILDGQIQELEDPFTVYGKTIMYPGAPEAAPELVYNCRCAISAYYPDSPPQNAKMRDDDPERKPIRSMTYQEWMAAKGGANKNEPEAAVATARFLNKGDRLYENAAKVQPIPGYEDIAVHGDRYGFVFKDADGQESNVSVSEFAEILRKSGTYKGGAIRLLSCETGAEDSITAQALANELGVEVMAPNGMLLVYPDGSLEIETDVLTKEGKWIIFKPDKR